jgi:DNA repair exonuclease SbcCD ATPase subunit
MGNERIMQQVRGLLSQGRSSGEVIALGYKPGTVYKVQRQLRLRQTKEDVPAPVMDQDEASSDGEEPEEVSAEDADLVRLFFGPVDEPDQDTSLRAELEQARGRIEELEAEAGKVQVLQERVHALEAEAEACIELRRRVRDLERQLKSAGDSETALRQTNAQWQTKFQEGRSAREQAERQVRDHQDQASQWQQAYQVINSKLEASTREITNLHAEIQKLEPLKAWTGHPCCVCGKSMTGSVSRELAAKLQKGIGHKRCLEARASGLGKVLLAGGALLCLSQLGKQ